LQQKTFGLIVVSIALLTTGPFFFPSRTLGTHKRSAPTPAPVEVDYLIRDKQIAFWENAERHSRANDMISPRMLATQYLMRYREHGDIGDVIRAREAASLSLRRAPIGNVAADDVMAGALLTLHQFRSALSYVDDALQYQPGNSEIIARKVGLEIEIGDYISASRLLQSVPFTRVVDPAIDTVSARYDELTNRLPAARRLLARSMFAVDAIGDAPAVTRSWYHFRAGQLAFEAGDIDEAIRDEHEALGIFPNDGAAWNALAKFSWATKNWHDALAYAQRAAEIMPLPDTLGYEVDAYRALGKNAEADRTNDLIAVIGRLGNTQHVADRLIAMYYADHHIHSEQAYRTALEDRSLRDDVFTEDTIAWTAARSGKWDVAQTAIDKALRLHTPDALIYYHAGVIAFHRDNRSYGLHAFQTALRLNPSFHPFFADDARKAVLSIAYQRR
jgi:tetratricopeptide (TPR) repeat protein